ncbi:MAG: acyl-(acyl-carrier-protein)--UDP-N-acetylglucosamine O-acyltransferase [Gammaproteobacteria bacterium]|nr:MAG: acyl-(acyl-carrier-protein)--UDP-N-acetylglucosamine O-acyltransferase [Gammaproteobacteria bacterium]TND07092.1 MAG: acyl-(acyl-carrier-protein)--UDP-N-acetylglucosamine O-acyltransferase [Gammaproteobacteria bacterium]
MIDTRAIVDPGARLAKGVTVGPFSIIGPDVEIGEGTWIGPHAVINGPTRIGRDNRIFQFASIGEVPQDKKFAGEDTRLEIGDRNTFRESCTIHRGTVQGGGMTRIGNDNWIMAYVHIAHDCIVGNNVIFANAASLAGHVTVDDHAILGGFTLVHQFCVIGAHGFTAMGSVIPKDVPPYLMVSGHMARPYGLNVEGLKRRGFSAAALSGLRRAYKILYKSGLTVDQAREQLAAMTAEFPEVNLFVEFLARSTRGIVR